MTSRALCRALALAADPHRQGVLGDDGVRPDQLALSTPTCPAARSAKTRPPDRTDSTTGAPHA